jgi:hypothetical protein
VDVVQTMPSDWERKSFDLRGFVTRVNRLKLRAPVLWGEGVLRAPWGLDGEVLLLERSSERADDSPGWLLLNRDRERHVEVPLEATPPGQAVGYRLHRVTRELAHEEGEEVPGSLTLEPSEVVFMLPT